MSVKRVREEFQKLSDEERADLLTDLMPEFCRTATANPALMQKMMPRCREMMRDSHARGFMRPMMEQMMNSMMEEGK